MLTAKEMVVLNDARLEILSLRQTLTLKQAKLDGIELAARLVYSNPPTEGGQAMAQDICHEIFDILQACKPETKPSVEPEVM